jgi:NAD+ synthase (glutamine-hydrolysing)
LGYEAALVERIVGMVGRAEYKRRQAAPVLKLSARAFGMGRRMPIARAIYEARA